MINESAKSYDAVVSWCADQGPNLPHEYYFAKAGTTSEYGASFESLTNGETVLRPTTPAAPEVDAAARRALLANRVARRRGYERDGPVRGRVRGGWNAEAFVTSNLLGEPYHLTRGAVVAATKRPIGARCICLVTLEAPDAKKS